MNACEKTTSNDVPVKPSFEIIQEKILNTSCAIAGCHASTSDATYAQHGLVLTPGKSYANLVGITPKNTAAANAGMKLIIPKDVEKSFLFRKLHVKLEFVQHQQVLVPICQWEEIF